MAERSRQKITGKIHTEKCRRSGRLPTRTSFAALFAQSRRPVCIAGAKGRRKNTTRTLRHGVRHTGTSLIVASMKNIHSVLDNQETEAWQKLIRVLTHEIMNSITPVTSLSELLEQQIGNFDGDAEERKEILQMLQTIRRRGDGLIRFVNSYREVSHLPQPLLKIYTDRELLAGIAQLMHTDRDDLHLVLPDKPLRLIIDKDLIEQVLINLIRNARENDATDIRLSTGLSSGERPYIRIEDNGTGIEQEVLERIFVPFFTTKTTGSGIGLTISRQIMHLHHGTITASSETGKGSNFTLLFPPLFKEGVAIRGIGCSHPHLRATPYTPDGYTLSIRRFLIQFHRHTTPFIKKALTLSPTKP